MRRTLAVAALILGVCIVSGCFPALTTVRPKVRLGVEDTEGRPVEGAAFTLATYRQPFPIFHPTVQTKLHTDREGTLVLRKGRKWVWQLLFPDGVTWYTWTYCVEKTGYRAAAATNPVFDDPIRLVLEETRDVSECVWPSGDDSYRQVRTTDDAKAPREEQP